MRLQLWSFGFVVKSLKFFTRAMSSVKFIDSVLALISTLWSFKFQITADSRNKIRWWRCWNQTHSSLLAMVQVWQNESTTAAISLRSRGTFFFGSRINLLVQILLVNRNPIIRVRLCHYSYCGATFEHVINAATWCTLDQVQRFSSSRQSSSWPSIPGACRIV